MRSLDESQHKGTQSRSRENPPGFTTSVLKTSSPQIHSLCSDSTITEQYSVYYCVLPSNVTLETGIPKWKKKNIRIEEGHILWRSINCYF